MGAVSQKPSSDLSWACVAHNPTVWWLGLLDGRKIHSPVATVTRCKDGAHSWQLLEAAWIQGHEPACDAAKAAAWKAYAKLQEAEGNGGASKRVKKCAACNADLRNGEHGLCTDCSMK